MVGDGAAIDPTDGTIVAPVSGTITVLFPTKHAIGITSDDGCGDPNPRGHRHGQPRGQAFDITVAQGDHVTAGQKLGTFDRAAIEQAGCSAQTMVIVSNTAEWATIELEADGSITAGDQLLSLRK